MSKEIYINQEGNSNKFWSYEISDNGRTVTFEHGRIGRTPGKPTIKTGNPYDIDALVEKKVKEKTRKGYKPKTKTELKKEEKTAKTLGSQYKIQDMKWVSGKETTSLGTGTLDVISKYDPSKYVFVQILNSWTKISTYLLLSKDSAIELSSVSMQRSKITYGRSWGAPDFNFVRAVKGVLNDLSAEVRKAVKRLMPVGARVLDFGDGDSSSFEPTFQEVTKVIAKSIPSVDKKVIGAIARMGERVLDF